jgi:hypothetical protein
LLAPERPCPEKWTVDHPRNASGTDGEGLGGRLSMFLAAALLNSASIYLGARPVHQIRQILAHRSASPSHLMASLKVTVLPFIIGTLEVTTIG